MYTPSVPSTFVVAICERAGACDQAAEAAAASPQARAARNMRFMSPPWGLCDALLKQAAVRDYSPWTGPLSQCYLECPALSPAKAPAPRRGALHFPMPESPRRIIHVDMDA